MLNTEKQEAEEDLIRELDELGLEFQRLIEEENNMANKTANRISDKLVKVNESFTINMYDNGFMIEASGRNKKDDYVTAKILCSSIDEVINLVREVADMERDS
jgi:hypothetical protein